MKSHTPGPWESRFANDYIHGINEDKNPVYVVYDPKEGDCLAVCQGVRAPNKANAHLIAAAPRLLEAAEAAENWFSEAEGGPDTGIDSLLVVLRAAIAEAKANNPCP